MEDFDVLPFSSIKKLLSNSLNIEKKVRIRGWARTVRAQKNLTFISIYDGSSCNSLQIVVPSTSIKAEIQLEQGCAIEATGIISESPGKGQSVELKATSVNLIAACPAETFPLQKKEHSLEFLRNIAHLRCRSRSINAIMRIRHHLSMATHNFFSSEGFCYLHSPILTSIDCEGAGEMFQVVHRGAEKEDSFFEKNAYLTVSGQLNAECFACGMGPVYTFGPTFRAENSHTPRHLCEFWMIEPEVPFLELPGLMDLSEKYLQFVLQSVLDKCQEELEICEKKFSTSLRSQLQDYIKRPFLRISYTDAINILMESNMPFNFPVKWGIDLQTEHERFLTEKYAQGPVIVFDFPEKIKAFYMRLNSDGITSASMDTLFPHIGEVIGGAQREDRLEVLLSQMDKKNIPQEPYWWYTDLRKFASIPHSGFGAGFERIIRLATGIENIRETIPFPRSPGSLDF